MWRGFGALLAASAALAHAQETTGVRPVFDVASVKVSGPQSKRDAGGGPGTSDPGRYHFNSATLRDLIATAYYVRFFRIVSKVPLDQGTFDVVAKVPVGATRDQFRKMIQSLLAERFHLKLHRESRVFPAWELTVAKSGSKLKESMVSTEPEPMSGPAKVGEDGFPVLAPDKPGFVRMFTTVDGFVVGRFSAQQQPVSVLTVSFGLDDPPIVDKTGLTGKYDFKLEFSRQPPGMSTTDAKGPPLPDLFTALEQQLGLHLADKKLPFDVLIADSVDRVPTEN